MANSYIPPRDSVLDVWAGNFTTLLTSNPVLYGLTTGDSVAAQSAYDTWHTAYLVASSPTTRTPDAIQAKDDARISMLAIIRPLAQRIANNAGVSSADKIGIGVNPRTNTGTVIPAPTTNPVVTISQAIPGAHILRFRDQLANPSVKAKPFGAAALQLFGGLLSTDATPGGTLISTPTKSPFMVNYGGSNQGQIAYYAGRWITRTGLTGPMSPVVSFPIT